MRILFESVCVAVAVAIFTQLYLTPPHVVVALFAVWLALSLLAGAFWSVMRARMKDRGTYNEFMTVADTLRAAQIRRDVARVSRELKAPMTLADFMPKKEFRHVAQQQRKRTLDGRDASHHPARKLYAHAATGGPGVPFTREQLREVNVQRRAKGRPMLSSQGFSRAIATAPATTYDSNHWLLYFIMFNSMGCNNHHLSPRSDPGAEVLIQPVGGGHGGVWTGGEVDASKILSPDVAPRAYDDWSDKGNAVPTPEPAPAPAPEPAYSAPSPSYDSSPSYSPSPSFDSSPSVSVDAGGSF